MSYKNYREFGNLECAKDLRNRIKKDWKEN